MKEEIAVHQYGNTRPSKKELERLYLNEKLSARNIGEIFDLPHSTILRWIKQEGIPRRDRSWRCKETGFKKGFTPWNKGKPVSEDVKKKISQSRKGIRASFQTEFKIGHTPWNKGLFIQTNTGRTHFKKGGHISPETEFQNLPKKQHLKLARKGYANSFKRPTKPERKIINYIQQHNLPLDYVGNGKLWIGNKNPDFTHKTKSIVIEVFGDYWHSEDEEKTRIDHFKKHGYDCLIVWEKEVDQIIKGDSGSSAWAKIIV